MLIAGDALAKTLAKSQKVIFWSQKNGFRCFFFFLLTAGDALTTSPISSRKIHRSEISFPHIFLDGKDKHISEETS